MCRGADLGICCAQGCDDRIRCQDTGGYCDAHDPFAWGYEDDDVPAPPAVTDDPEKRRIYTLAGLSRAIMTAESSISAEERRLADMRARMVELNA